MFSSTKIKTAFLFLTVLFFSLSAHADTVTITTYYPSPYGVYDELRANKVAIGDSYVDDPVTHTIPNAIDLMVEGGISRGGTVGTSADQVNLGDSTARTNGRWCAVLGGQGNYAGGQRTVAVGGANNQALNNNTFVGGGEDNVVSMINSAILGGDDNEITSRESAIAGGYRGEITSQRAFVGGGHTGEVAGHNSATIGGYGPTIDASNNAVILGGYQNHIHDGASQSVIIGGEFNNIYDNVVNTVAMGAYARPRHSNSFVWRGSSGVLETRAANTFNAYGDAILLGSKVSITDAASTTTFVPQRPLHVRTRYAQTAVLIEGDNQNPNITFSRNVDGNNKGIRLEYNRGRDGTDYNDNVRENGSLRIQRSYGTGAWDSHPTIATFNSNNRIGFGTESPRAPLHVVGPDVGTSDPPTYYPGLIIQNPQNKDSDIPYGVGIDFKISSYSGTYEPNKKAQIRAINSSSNSSLSTQSQYANDIALTFWSGGSTTSDVAERMRIAHNGNVGIGASDFLNDKLEVDGKVHIWGGRSSGGNRYQNSTSLDLAIDDSDSGIDCPADGIIDVYANGGRQLRITSGTRALEVWGEARKHNGGDRWNNSSDRRLKDIKGNIDNAVDLLMNLKPVKYMWNEIAKEKYGEEQNVMKYGFVAQDIKEVIPQFVNEPDEEGYYTINISGLDSIITASIQEIKKEKDAEIAELRMAVAELRKEIEGLKK